MKRSIFYQIVGCLLHIGEEKLASDFLVRSSLIENFLRSFFQSPKEGKMGHVSVTNTGNNKWVLYDYDTPILLYEYNPSGTGMLYLNTDRYSATTAKLQASIKRNLPSYTKIKEINEPELQKLI